MKLCKYSVILAGTLLAGSGLASAGSVDVVEATTGYFLPQGVVPYYINSPYYRWWDEDWEWQHAKMDATGLASATLTISAWDVDDHVDGEVDVIQLWDNSNSSWVDIGTLVGTHLGWSETTFILAASWYDAIAAGLQVRIDIDANYSAADPNHKYAVTLSKSVLSLTQVPLPATAWLFATGLFGLMAFSRWSKART